MILLNKGRPSLRQEFFFLERNSLMILLQKTKSGFCELPPIQHSYLVFLWKQNCDCGIIWSNLSLGSLITFLCKIVPPFGLRSSWKACLQILEWNIGKMILTRLKRERSCVEEHRVGWSGRYHHTNRDQRYKFLASMIFHDDSEWATDLGLNKWTHVKIYSYIHNISPLYSLISHQAITNLHYKHVV